jgi:hypothetical protein
MPAALLEPSPPGLCPDVSGNLTWAVAKAVTEDLRQTLPARSPLVAATVAGHAPFPRDEVDTEYGRSERGREDRGNARALPLLPLREKVSAEG